MSTYKYTGTASRYLRKRVPLEGSGNGFTTVSDGQERGDVELEIDVGELIRTLGGRALDSKSGRASAQHGAIKVKVSNRRRFAQ